MIYIYIYTLTHTHAYLCLYILYIYDYIYIVYIYILHIISFIWVHEPTYNFGRPFLPLQIEFSAAGAHRFQIFPSLVVSEGGAEMSHPSTRLAVQFVSFFWGLWGGTFPDFFSFCFRLRGWELVDWWDRRCTLTYPNLFQVRLTGFPRKPIPPVYEYLPNWLGHKARLTVTMDHLNPLCCRITRRLTSLTAKDADIKISHFLGVCAWKLGIKKRLPSRRDVSGSPFGPWAYPPTIGKCWIWSTLRWLKQVKQVTKHETTNFINHMYPYVR